MGSRLVRVTRVSLAALAVVVLGSELLFRACVAEATAGPLARLREFLLTGEMRGYEARAYTVFQRPRSTGTFNSLGFNDHEWRRERTPGVPRILCLGGSTTESGNPSVEGSYPRLLERTLEARTGRDFEVMNAGISGWTTAEILVAWFLTLQDFAPDVVVLHEAVNDLEPRFLAGFRPDYTHWRCPIRPPLLEWPERWLVRASDIYVWLLLRRTPPWNIVKASTYRGAPQEPLVREGRLPHETSLAFRRNLRNIALAVRAGGGMVVLMTLPTSPAPGLGEFWRFGVAENNQHLRELAVELGAVLADAALAFEGEPEMNAHFLDFVHLDPAGNERKAEIVADALAPWLATLSHEGAVPPAK